MDVVAQQQSAEALTKPALAQVDRLLEGMPDPRKRIAFLERQVWGWRDRWARFVCEHEGQLDPPPPAEWTASEFHILISELEVRLAAERAAAREAA